MLTWRARRPRCRAKIFASSSTMPCFTRTPRTLVLDLGGVGFMDSSGGHLGASALRPQLGGTAHPARAEQLRRECCSAGIACGDEPAGKDRRNDHESRENSTKPSLTPSGVQQKPTPAAPAALPSIPYPFLARPEPEEGRRVSLVCFIVTPTGLRRAHRDDGGHLSRRLREDARWRIKRIGIPDICAMEPFLYAATEERSCCFAVMQRLFMDKVQVRTSTGPGVPTKRIRRKNPLHKR